LPVNFLPLPIPNPFASANTFPLVLRNPLYFIFLILLAIGAYVTYTLNLWGPMLNMANAASAQALEEGKKRLREFLETTETGRAALQIPGESFEMSATSSSSSPRKAARRAVEEEEVEAEEI
jgi:protein SEY1